MVDKIVQLEDEDGNNIFPLCRGLGNDTVTTAAIQDGAVTSDKVDWSSMTPVWTTFVFNGTSEDTFTVTTRLGNTLTILRANGGTLVKISGATKVIAYRQTIWAKHNSNTGDFGLSNVKPNNTFYTRVYSRASNGTKYNTEEVSHNTSSEDYFTLAATAGNKTQFKSIAEGWRQPEDTMWEVRGTITAGGAYTALDYSIHADTADSGKIPVPYLRGANSSNVTSSYMVLEVLETN